LARVKDTRLELSVNFNRKILKGKAILTIEKEPFVTEIVRKFIIFISKKKKSYIDFFLIYNA